MTQILGREVKRATVNTFKIDDASLQRAFGEVEKDYRVKLH
jgi:hypothetical protein